MNITKKQIDDLSLQVHVLVEEADYSEKVKKALQDIRRNLDLKGFRKGMVPLGLVQKMLENPPCWSRYKPSYLKD